METSFLNNSLVCINILTVMIFLVVGCFHADFKNWQYQDGEHKPEGFINGFLPYGWQGVFAACAKCFFAYVGFDGVASAGEEAKDPVKTIPRATLLVMFIVSSVYISVSAVLTLMLPYHMISSESGIPDALSYHKAYWARYAVSVGAMVCMVNTIIGTIYAVSRVIYAMAEDGLMPIALQRTFRKVPYISMTICALSSATIAAYFDTDAIIDMLSIGTLFAYMVVAMAVLIVRHDIHPKDENPSIGSEIKLKNWASALRFLYPNMSHKNFVTLIIMLVSLLSFVLGFGINAEASGAQEKSIIGVSGALIVVLSFYLFSVDEVSKNDKYKMPLAPFLPIASIVSNAFLMTTLPVRAWERLLSWMGLGLVLYLSVSIRHSKLNQPKSTEFAHFSGYKF